jgi:hypothetical protein
VPLAVDVGHPFPFISNLALNTASGLTTPVETDGPNRIRKEKSKATVLKGLRVRRSIEDKNGWSNDQPRPKLKHEHKCNYL